MRSTKRDQLRVRADVVERVAGERELDLQVLGVFVDRSRTAAASRAAPRRWGSSAGHSGPRGGELVLRQEAGDDRRSRGGGMLELLVGDAHGVAETCMPPNRDAQGAVAGRGRERRRRDEAGREPPIRVYQRFRLDLLECRLHSPWQPEVRHGRPATAIAIETARQRHRGCGIEGAKEGEHDDDANKKPGKDQNLERLARPGPGMKANPDVAAEHDEPVHRHHRRRHGRPGRRRPGMAPRRRR